MNYDNLFRSVYKGKKVLLTGHTGFKGSWMLTWLHELGAVVKGFALAPENKNDLYCLINGDSLCDSVIADIRNYDKVEKEVTAFAPDFIFHMAAQPLVRRSYEEPLYTFEVNVNGTANVLEAVRKLEKPCAVVVITTDKVYENREQHYHYKETDKLGGYDPYSASKAAAEIVVNSYRNSYFHPDKYQDHKKGIASARAGNVIGGGDRAKDRIIPDIIRGIEKNENIIVRNPSAVRPWQHVLEPLSGYLLLGTKLTESPQKFSDGWNFGPLNNDVLTVKEVVENALTVWGTGSYSSPQLNNQVHEANLLMLDITKAEKELEWHPKLNSKQAINDTITWYKNADSGNALDYTRNQILKYEEL